MTGAPAAFGLVPFWRETPAGIAIAVKVQPKSRRPGLQGHAPSATGERLRIGVTEAAEGGRANRAACAVLAEALGIAAGRVSVAAGATSREKTLLVTGEPATVLQGLSTL